MTMTAKQQPTPADTTRALATSASKKCIGNNDAKHATPAAPATPLVDDGVRHSAVDNINIDNNDDDVEEEEMISLGLSASGNMNDDGNGNGSDVVVGVDGSSSSRTKAMVGNNRKSVLPATPAAASSSVVYSQQHPHSGGNNYEGYGPPMRRTPGPGSSVAHQARHRRTPGAGQNGHNDVGIFFVSFCLLLRLERLIASVLEEFRLHHIASTTSTHSLSINLSCPCRC